MLLVGLALSMRVSPGSWAWLNRIKRLFLTTFAAASRFRLMVSSGLVATWPSPVFLEQKNLDSLQRTYAFLDVLKTFC